ncbi:hypothetical protein [Pontibacter sp. SGAir0037]|uniref:hypothetical protein n=1 Tax=Pontibacter sp. SGAir0037 TaxID=2571030 RepID=UPI0010CD5765|nr:hypothetical protein [Pontibacter sp. SGAir0037]QCR24786.1 hypothetical protein C1N53_22135 [Pontibacter sp. SGAir0037]
MKKGRYAATLTVLFTGTCLFFASCGGTGDGDATSEHAQPEATHGDNINLEPTLDSTATTTDPDSAGTTTGSTSGGTTN